MANPIRTGLKPFSCVGDVNCGDQIAAVWGNSVRNLGQSAFERGDNVLSLRCQDEGNLKFPIIGNVWNMIESYSNNNQRLVTWRYDSEIRFQPAYPKYNHGLNIYIGSNADGSPYGAPIIDNGIEGKQYNLGEFENAGYTYAEVFARFRRGERYDIDNTEITDASYVAVFEFKENEPSGVLAYRQHVQCWYMQENPSGAMFPPVKTLIFDDTDCPLLTETVIQKKIALPLTPNIGETTMDWIVVSIWNEARYSSLVPTEPYYGIGSYWVCNTKYEDFDMNSDGLFSISCKLFKEC